MRLGQFIDDIVENCYGAALLLASIEARVAVMEARGERPPVYWEDAKPCVRGILAAGVSHCLVPELEARLCAIAEDCGVSNPREFFA